MIVFACVVPCVRGCAFLVLFPTLPSVLAQQGCFVPWNPLPADIRAKSPAAFRLLKLIWCGLFRPYFFEDPEVVGYGAYGTVYRMRHVTTGQDFAIKLMEKPRTTEDRCVLHDLFTEVLIMDRHKDDARICHLLDYGVTKDHYYVVMKCYTMSLKAWRREQVRLCYARILWAWVRGCVRACVCARVCVCVCVCVFLKLSF